MRIRLYSLSIDEIEEAILVKFITPLDPKPLVGVYNDLAKVEKLKKKYVRIFSAPVVFICTGKAGSFGAV
ncbi:MAG: hypothetical protein EXR10_04395 [Alphaproteobacteria bacterium]|nr:hypothetical protein [Alphaproteobacteria bacterium]PHX99923.1 MAG: hypothetical protein CK529_07495 [Rhodospirillaceae bacterium]